PDAAAMTLIVRAPHELVRDWRYTRSRQICDILAMRARQFAANVCGMKVVIGLQLLIRILAVVQVTLGILFWTGNAFTFIPLHMLSGLLLVLAIWLQAGLALRFSGSLGLAVLAFGWGAVVVALGMTQDSLLPGDLHWLIKVLHLLVGLGAVGLAEALAHQSLDRAGYTRRAVSLG